jgi:hypothetical protein
MFPAISLRTIPDCTNSLELSYLRLPGSFKRSARGNMEGNRRPQTYTGLVLTAGLLLIVSVLSYLNIQLGVSNGFRYAGGLRIAFLLICLAFLAGAISGLTQLSKR